MTKVASRRHFIGAHYGRTDENPKNPRAFGDLPDADATGDVNAEIVFAGRRANRSFFEFDRFSQKRHLTFTSESIRRPLPRLKTYKSSNVIEKAIPRIFYIANTFKVHALRPL